MIQQKLGFNNFIELGYIRMDRTDYNPEMVVNLRNQVLEYIVPLVINYMKNKLKD